MHKYAHKIGEHIKECYCPSEMNREELKELGEWADIMKDLMEYDLNKSIVEAMEKEEHITYPTNWKHNMKEKSTYDWYMEAHKKYSETKSKEDKEMMMKHMNKYVSELMDTLIGMWEGVEPEHKAMLKEKVAEIHNAMK